jgi:hypothetical protein
MRPKTLVLGLNAALLLSTAVIAADPAAPAPLVIEEEEPLFTLSIHGGVTAFGIPDTAPVGVTNDGDAGTLGDVDLFEGLDNPLYGGTVGIDMSAPINGDGTSINFSGFGSFVTRDGSQSRTLNEEQYLVVHGPNMPTGQIDLDTIDLDVDNVGTTTSDWGDATAGVNAGGGLATGTGTLLGPGYNVASNADGFVLSGAQGDYGTYAFGVIATTEGVVFLGSGELQGTEIDTDVTQDLAYAGGDITVSQRTTPDDSGVAFTVYGGPSFRYMGTETTTDTTIQVNQDYFNTVDFQYPTFNMNTVENIDTYYAGAVFGGNVDIDVWTGAKLSLGLGAGVYYASSSYDSTTEASIFGGLGGAGGTVDESVTSNFDLDPEEGFAYTLKGSSTFSADISDNMQINFGLGAEYMSRVATSRFVGEDGAVLTADGLGVDDADGDYNGANATGGTVLAFGDAWSFKATAGLTGQF